MSVGLLPLPTSVTVVEGDVFPPDGVPTLRLEPLAGMGPEGYRLSVRADGATITASSEAGLFYGTQTLRQLAWQQPNGISPVDIADTPRYAYRGYMLDVARHFFPVATVKAVLDRMSLLKLNHLHLHLTDDQGWRIEIRSRPELTARASQSEVGGGPGGFYTHDEFREIVDYAAERFITIVPEVDVPGHTHAVSLAYPELVEEPALVPSVIDQSEQLGLELPVFGEAYTSYVVGHSSLKTASAAVEEFVADVIQELAGLTPGPYLHIGGDECHGTPKEAFTSFDARAAATAAATGKTPVGWHERGASRELPEGTIGQVWGLTDDDGSAGVPTHTVVDRGGKVILSPADAIYVDHKYAAEDPIGLAWANGPTTVEDSYAWEPDTLIAGISGDAILGVEAALWTETVTSLADIDWLTFPRAAAAAEKAWSQAGASDWESFRTRLGAQGPLWRSEGIGFFESPEIPWN